MNSAKLILLKKTFENKFNMDMFKIFTREFFNEPEMLSGKRHTGIWREYEKSIISYSDIAKYKDSEGNTIIILVVELKSEVGVEKARSLQRNFISKILSDQNCEAAIVAFYSSQDVNWRLSFVRLDYTFNDKGIEIDITPAKRFSYLVGENETSHTAQKQLYPIFEDDKHNPTLNEIEMAFSVEKVTKDFFEQYKNKYFDLKEYLENDEPFIEETKKLGYELDKFSEQFAKKLMGQIAFLYFLQKKGWLGVRIMPEDHCIDKDIYQKIYKAQDKIHKTILDKLFTIDKDEQYKLSTRIFHSISIEEAELLSDCFIGTELDNPWGSGNKRFLREIFDFCENNTNKNFFDDFLQPFFYEALNKRRENQYYKQFNCKIPFLNGGLFEPIEGYHWRESKFEIPNNIFSNLKEFHKEADGILDIFDRYNFTMNEDEPLEKEVAVDPEMLGKIFENLLDGEDRKAKGAFYTPREIVHYMCQESIINYLVNEVNVPYEDIKEFILFGEIIRDADNRSNVGYGKGLTIKQSVYDKIVEIDEALKNIRVADPAVGSGAFPLGMLNEIVKARNNITEYLIRIDKSGKLDRKYGESYIRKARSQYKMKWNTIKNSIFAVDIEPSAVDIAKLRLWLSVVVEQEIDDENKEPHPLPNLDCNIMVGNSLVDEFCGIQLFDSNILYKQKNNTPKDSNKVSYKEVQLSLLIDHSDEWLKEMFELQDRYFDEDDDNKKKGIKVRIDTLRDELIQYKLNREGNSDGLRRFNQMKKSKLKPYFIWELEFAKVFKENGGFDIIIGNPPYVGESGHKEIFRPIALTEFGKKFYQGKMDLFYFFFHKGIDIGTDKACISFITTNYFLNAFGAKTLREDIQERSNILKMINFNELRIFETARGQHNIITFLTKIKEGNQIVKCSITNKIGNATNDCIRDILACTNGETIYFDIPQTEIFDEYGNIVFHNEDTILKKMEQVADFKLTDKDIGNGIDILQEFVTDKHLEIDSSLTRNEGVFALSNEELSIMKLNINEKDVIVPYYTTEQIKKYAVKGENKLWIIYSDKSVYTNIDSYPNIKKHLDKFSKIITSDNKPYGLHRSREKAKFVGEKILSLRMTKKPCFSYTSKDTYVTRAFLIIKPHAGINLKLILGILNSKLAYYWFFKKGKRKGQQLQIDKDQLLQFPLILSQNTRIVNAVNRIIEMVKCGSEEEIQQCQKEIDSGVYELYSLSEEEISKVEEVYNDGRC